MEQYEWYNFTPWECIYQLIMFGADGEAEQVMHITRSEYIRLKAFLAELRGIKHDLDDDLDEAEHTEAA